MVPRTDKFSKILSIYPVTYPAKVSEVKDELRGGGVSPQKKMWEKNHYLGNH